MATVGLSCQEPQPRMGLVGGLGATAGADILHRIIQAAPDRSDGQHLDISFVQHPFREALNPSDPDYGPTGRKLYVYDMIRTMQAGDRDIALVPCFVSQTFLDEVVPEVDIQVIGIGEAIRDKLQAKGNLKLGVLTSTYVRKTAYLEAFFAPAHQVIYPNANNQAALMEAIYGPDGLKSREPAQSANDAILKACGDLLDQGADVILPGFTDIPALMGSVFETAALPLLDCNQIFADYVARTSAKRVAKPFKVGVVGGVGPAATVDFISRVVENTPAARDQDHIKVVVEQNPQIPDRTANLAGHGNDPTVALYATCKKLEQAGADIIAIPCNTAHAFVDRIQGHIQILIVNMLTETVAHIMQNFSGVRRVGLLATSGTVQSQLYHAAANSAGLDLIAPDPAVQDIVMESIYGENGVKAGFTSGVCKTQLREACNHLRDLGAEVLILGCTELPLIRPAATADLPPMLDPTEILARKCVSLARTAGAYTPDNTQWSSAHV